MYTDILNIVLAFLEGFVLILSPCILPILPIVLSGSLTGNKNRPIGIIVGFVTSFTIVTLFIRFFTHALHISPDHLRNISLALLLLLGVMMISNYLSEQFNLMTQRLMSIPQPKMSTEQESGFWGGFILGLLIGIIWTPCAGPILAVVIVQVVLQKTTLTSFLTILMFAIGVAIPMLLIALLGRRVTAQFGFFRQHADLIRKILGITIILSVIALYYNPTFGISTERIKQSATLTSSLDASKLIDGLTFPYPAPEIGGITAWINSPPLTLAQLRGKIVLIDFWTYSCINCIRTLPYLKDWYAKYHDKGFEIIGIHSPEFAFEHDLNNVKEAVSKDGIIYPVALDNNFVTWTNYNNHYWPGHYLIDKQGNVVYVHFGEGNYDITENNIRYLLGLQATHMKPQAVNENFNQTPETYLGYARMQHFASNENIMKDKIWQYHLPNILGANQWALEGSWLIKSEKIISEAANNKLELHFNAAHVYAVMGIRDTPVTISIHYETQGQGIVETKNIQVTDHQLYELVNLKQPSEGRLTLTVLQPGLEIYTFTFG